MSVCTPVTKETLPFLLDRLERETNAEKFMGVQPSRMVDHGWKWLHLTESLIFGAELKAKNDTVIVHNKFVETVKERTRDARD